jgi:hypothetical protein
MSSVQAEEGVEAVWAEAWVKVRAQEQINRNIFPEGSETLGADLARMCAQKRGTTTRTRKFGQTEIP